MNILDNPLAKSLIAAMRDNQSGSIHLTNYIKGHLAPSQGKTWQRLWDVINDTTILDDDKKEWFDAWATALKSETCNVDSFKIAMVIAGTLPPHPTVEPSESEDLSSYSDNADTTLVPEDDASPNVEVETAPVLSPLVVNTRRHPAPTQVPSSLQDPFVEALTKFICNAVPPPAPQSQGIDEDVLRKLVREEIAEILGRELPKFVKQSFKEMLK